MILIGLPIYKRAWILPHWFKAIENQTYPLDDLGFIFECAPDDEETFDALFSWYDQHPEVGVFDVGVSYESHQEHPVVDHGKGPVQGRFWNVQRYVTMMNLRNSLLQRARCIQPRKYFSLDSDIILEDPTTISKLDALDYDVVSPLMYMTPSGTDFPSVMSWTEGPGSRALRLNPYPIGKVFRADVVMAAKLMSEKVYTTVDYSVHRQGEDLGFSANCARAGFALYCASNVYSCHVMNHKMLEDYLVNGDPRSRLNKT